MFLPWEKWLPPWLFGPLLVAGGVFALAFEGARLAWWEWVLLPIGVAYGAWGTWAWFMTRQNVFAPIAGLETEKDGKNSRADE